MFRIVKISNFVILYERERLMTIMFEITVVATIKVMAISEKQYHFTFQGYLLVHNHTHDRTVNIEIIGVFHSLLEYRR